VKVRELIRILEEDGWRLVRTTGSHRQFKHFAKAGVVTVAGRLGHDVPFGTMKSILKQAGLKVER
jgi:predicted RNA binding protein YcfA (HicA-like mRNA interferase family)